MGLIVRTNIAELDESSNKEDVLLNNYIKGAGNLDFNVDTIEVKKISLDYAKSLSFSIEIFEKLDTPISKITFLHIYCVNKILNPEDSLTPIKFKVHIKHFGDESESLSENFDLTTFGDADDVLIYLGKFSQFQLVDIDEYVSEIKIDGIVLEEEQKAELIIISGGKE